MNIVLFGLNAFTLVACLCGTDLKLRTLGSKDTIAFIGRIWPHSLLERWFSGTIVQIDCLEALVLGNRCFSYRLFNYFG